MNKARLLSTVAATLLLVGAASAQDMKKDEAPGRAPAAQQNAPAEKVAPAQKSAPALRSERKTPETTGQAPKEPEGNQMNAPKGKDTQMKKGAQTEKAEPRAGAKGSAENTAAADMKAKDEHNASENRMAPAAASRRPNRSRPPPVRARQPAEPICRPSSAPRSAPSSSSTG